ncbi:hypothetical protein RU98_GL002165 [Enterococcus caccae]|nr:hypothetical protein RU98_GL002165 [Enterococcus caccae]
MPKLTEDAVWDATFDITEEVAARAAGKLQSNIKYGSGELAGSIKNEVVINGQGNVVGRVWSDKKEALFREMGTGPVGEASTKQLPEGVNPVYTQETWFISADKVSVDLEAVYGIPKITIKGNDFYMTKGQPARPFMYPSLLEAMENAPDEIRDRVQSKLNEGLK